MEILIVGLIIVALMVYASTRIKRSAAAAFEAETIELIKFVIAKPEGFLHNLNADARYEFEAYSKGFSEDHPKFRVGTARVTAEKGSSLDDAVNDIAASETVIEDISEVLDGRRYRVLTVTKKDGEIMFRKGYKLAAADNAVLKLEVTSLDTEPDAAWVETFINGFRVK